MRRLGPADIHALTSLDKNHLERVILATRPPGRTRGRPPALTHRERVTLVAVALRTNLTERALAALFTTNQSVAHWTLAALIPALWALFETNLEPCEDVLLDGTLIPVHDQTRTACSKNYRRSVNIQVMSTTSRRVIQIGTPWPGNRNDIIVARETITLPEGVKTLTDGGYRSLPGAILPPPRQEPDTRAAHRRIRARIEHVLARLKDWQILRQCRRRGQGIDHAIRAVAYLYNLRLEFRINS